MERRAKEAAPKGRANHPRRDPLSTWMRKQVVMEMIVWPRWRPRKRLEEQVGAPAIIAPQAMGVKGDRLLSGNMSVPKCPACDGLPISISLLYMRLRGLEGKKVSSPAHTIHGWFSVTTVVCLSILPIQISSSQSVFLLFFLSSLFLLWRCFNFHRTRWLL